MTSVSHAKHRQIREIGEIRVRIKQRKIHVKKIRVITSLRSVGLRRISCSKTIISCSTNINHRSEFFLNTNNPNNTNIFWHTDLTDLTDLLAYGLLLLWDSWICNITQKMTSVSHAKHRQIREICFLC